MNVNDVARVDELKLHRLAVAQGDWVRWEGFEEKDASKNDVAME